MAKGRLRGNAVALLTRHAGGVKGTTGEVVAVLLLVGGIAVGALFLFGVFKQWAGSYTGIVRHGPKYKRLTSQAEPATISVMKKGSGAVVLLATEESGDCAIDVHRSLCLLASERLGSQRCSGKTPLYFEDAELSLDGDSLDAHRGS